jgi:2-dehydro-3-deoxyphosphogluconate aldolase/(4S)-4-hydroxy-2-oxoglutarate aldolase
MDTTHAITSSKIVAVVRLEDYARAVEVARALVAGGITTLEFTLTGRGAIDAVSRTRTALGDSATVGIGTALTASDTRSAIDAGAQFVVTPALRREVIATCVERSVPVACGGFTPTELLDAHEAGATFVKLFPASSVGPKYIKDVLAPLPFLKIIPTGGVSVDNARDFITAGAVAVGVGGNLIPARAVAAGAFDEITANAQGYVRAVG